MGEKESDKPAQVNLELPSFGLRRKRKEKAAEEPEGLQEAAPEAEETAAVEAAPVETADTPEPVAAEPVTATAEPAAPEPVAAEPVTPAAPPVAASRFSPPASSEPAAEAVSAEPVATERPAPVAAPRTQPTPDVLPADEAVADPVEGEPARPKKSLRDQLPEFRAPRLPVIPTMTASAITGLVIGLLACGLTYAGLQGCEAIKNNNSCGGPGLLLVLLILVLLVLAGTALLKLFAVRDAGSVSFLAVGLLAMLILLILVPWLFRWWMVIVIPAIATCTYMAAHWITSMFDED